MFKKGKINQSILVLSLLLSFLVVSSVPAFAAEGKIVLKQYPELKIGFTTAQFLKFLPTTAPNVKQLIDFAAAQGFAFVEVRDPSAKLSLADCKELAAYAGSKKIELIYAINTGLMDPAFAENFSRAIANAGAFNGPRVVRAAAFGPEFNQADKKYWTADEYALLVEKGNNAANMAKSFGLTFLFENALEGLKGDGVNTFGFSDLVRGVNSNVGLQLDTANFFGVSRVYTEPQDAKAFFVANVGRTKYVHLKTSINKKTQPVIGDNELPFEEFFRPSVDAGMLYYAIELDPGSIKTLDQMFDNHKKSVEYLKSKF